MSFKQWKLGRGLRIMLHEARDRQKFLSDAQYLRDMQHKVESEYQACLRRQEYRRDPNEKHEDQTGGQETNSEKSQFSNGTSFKQTSGEEDPLAKPRLAVKNSAMKCESRLPAIDQTSVKQKDKSTMTTRKPENMGTSKPSAAAHSPQILSKKRRPNLGRLTVSPDLQSPGAPGDRSRQKSQLLVKALALRGADPVQQEGPMWTSNTKLKRPMRERRNLVPSSEPMTMTKNTPERARKGGRHAPSQKEPQPAPSQAFPGTNKPQVSSEALGPLPFTTTMGESRWAPFRFRDEDFYSVLSLSCGGESDDTEEETHEEEERLLAGMRAPHSPSCRKRSQFLGTSAPPAKNKNFEENLEDRRANSVRKRKSNHGSLSISNIMEPVREQAPVGQRMSQDPRLPNGGTATENDSGDSENEDKTFHSRDTKLDPNLEDDLSTEDAFSDGTSVEDRPGTHDYEREWQTYLNNSSTPHDYFLSSRPRSPMNSSYNPPGSLAHSALRDDIPVDLSMTSTLVHSSNSEGTSRFNPRRPLSPIRNRNPCASPENQSYFPANSALEFDVRGAEASASTSQPQGAALYTEDLLLNPQSSLSSVETSSSPASRTNVQGHFSVPGSLQENVPLTFLAASDLPNQNVSGDRMAVSGFTDEKGATKMKADPEKLKKFQESLLEEDSEEEGDSCRICQMTGGSPTNPLLEPCSCVGSLQFVHQECLKKWLKVKITSGADLGAVKTCEMCKQGLLVDLDDFNLTEFYRKHQQSRVQNELMNSGLYLVLLLHLYEQRFAELIRLNYSRAARARLSRNFPQPRPEENENSELGDGNENGIYQSNSRVV
ncbi:probable E3 ubiquitin-protein ligase MARCHF10 isoform X2 [Desmodus rotundus]|uniref:probable E3 ubiquitin-protein ligase MARCHF10 isoform X2 n=1 Tax=Desmodus rotundus TaxID=9430 RepID=UPI002380F0FB|nr:probable E3 ubiquitin-protein ligase MARCHF10 isoform X2 [Desmodus rotundus]